MRIQCVRNWVKSVEPPALLQLANAKSTAIFRFKTFRESPYNSCAILRPILPVLFLLKYPASKIPVHHHAIEIYASNGICAGSVDNLASVGKQFLANGFANCVRTALSAKYLNAILREFAIASHYGHTSDECCCYYYSID